MVLVDLHAAAALSLEESNVGVGSLSSQIHAQCCLQAEKETLRGRGEREHEWGRESGAGRALGTFLEPRPSPLATTGGG